MRRAGLSKKAFVKSASSARRERTSAARRASTFARVRRCPRSAGPRPPSCTKSRGARGRLAPGRNAQRREAGPFIDARPYLPPLKAPVIAWLTDPRDRFGRLWPVSRAAGVAWFEIDLPGVERMRADHSIEKELAVAVIDFML